MVRKVQISDVSTIERVVLTAADCAGDVGLHDRQGRIADAKSILGLLSLDYSEPVMVVSEDAAALSKVCRALA